MTFKPGDRVVCVSASDSKYFKVINGKSYTVAHTEDEGEFVHLREVEGSFFSSRFRLIPAALDDQEYNEIISAQDLMDTLTNGQI